MFFFSLFLRLNLFSATQVENDLNYKNLDKLKLYIDKSINNLPGTFLLFEYLKNVLNMNDYF